MRCTARLIVALAIALLVNGARSRVDAATFTVNSVGDTTDGSCTTDPGGCTLREAVEAAVATAGRDTIRFDPSVFPKGPGVPQIILTSALPVIADPAGTIVDGAGAGVFIGGGNNNVEEGLVFASAAGVPLVKVTVANLIVAGFTGTAVHICGGALSACSDDVSDTFVNHLVTNAASDGDGIRVEGRNVTKTRIVDSVAFHVGGDGIRLFAEGSLVGARIQGCTARLCDEGGIRLRAAGDIVGATIVDSTAVQNGSSGITIDSDSHVSKAKLTNVVVDAVDGAGIFVGGDEGMTGVAIADSTSSAVFTGIVVQSVMPSTGLSLTGVVVDRNGIGAAIMGETSATKITRTVALANNDVGLTLMDNAVDASVSSVIAAANGADGLFMRATTSTLQRVRADGNLGNGITLSPLQDGLSGLGSGNTVQKSIAFANDGSGILVDELTTDSVLQKNVALGNGDHDLQDINANCDANVWSANTFRTSNQPCIH